VLEKCNGANCMVCQLYQGPPARWNLVCHNPSNLTVGLVERLTAVNRVTGKLRKGLISGPNLGRPTEGRSLFARLSPAGSSPATIFFNIS
jgi:hypothetical protein